MQQKTLTLQFIKLIIIGVIWGISLSPVYCQTPTGYKLVWSDEFNGTTIDPSNWGYDIGGSGWGNNELQYYTDRSDNAYLNQGNLVIEAKRENFGGKNYTSARLLTKNKRDFLFGRIEIRAKLPKGQGIWPALWSLGKNIDQVGWPACGEIDIMEVVGHEPNKSYGTVHYAPSIGAYNYISNNYTLTSGDFSDDFHIFSVEWENNQIKFYVDNNLFATLNNSTITGNYPFNNPFFLIFNVAVGGNWPGSPDANTIFPQKMLIDYVRVYQPESLLLAGPTIAAPNPTPIASRVISLYSNAYTNVPIDTWSAPWDNADVTDVVLAEGQIKKYSNLTFAGIEFHSPGPTIDATNMDRFHADIWTPDATSFKLKLVDFGTNGIFGGGDDTEHEVSFAPTLGNWYSIDIPLSNFSNLSSKSHIAQMVLVADGGNKSIWLDNVYFYRLPPTEPTSAATSPIHSERDVISLYSNAYNNVAIDTWSAVWDQADIEDVSISGNSTKKYTNLTLLELNSTHLGQL
jgi:beta-glucanase (GH16 family)